MKTILGLLSTVALLTLAVPAQAQTIVANLGTNPTSGSGAFSNSVGGASFDDAYTFQLIGSPSFFTFASATNDFAQASDFITGFTGQLFSQVGSVGGGDDIAVSAPVFAQACPGGSGFCQVLAGSAVLAAGDYYLELTGQGGGTAGYGGNLTTLAVPGPLAGMGLVPLFGAVWLVRRRRRQA
jgi:hypothetical protein